MRLRSFTTPPNLKELEQKLDEVRKEKDAAVQSQEFEKAASLRDTEQRLREQVEDTKKSWKEKQGQETQRLLWMILRWLYPAGPVCLYLKSPKLKLIASQYGKHSSFPRHRPG